MVLDFADLKKAYKAEIEPYVEHQHLNDTMEGILPEYTTELLAGWILQTLHKHFNQIYKVRLWEGKTSFVEVCESDLTRGRIPWGAQERFARRAEA